MAFWEHYFTSTVLCLGTMYLVVALVLWFFKAPDTDVFRPYRVSKMLLSACFAVLAIDMFACLVIFDVYGSHTDWPLIVLDLSLYYIVAKLFSFAFSNLLDKNYLTPYRLKKAALKSLVISLLLIIPLCHCVAEPAKYVCVGIALSLITKFYIDFVIFLYRRLKKMKADIDNYYSEDKTDRLEWVHRCIILVVILGIFATITVFQGVLFNLCFHLSMVFFNLYFVIGFLNYKDIFAGVAKAVVAEEVKDEESKPTATSTATSDYTIGLIESKVTKWVDEKEFKKSQFTIEEIAQEIGTNKTYLSNFINSKFGDNFSVWVTKLRVEESKTLMMKHPDSKLETIAFEVGFSSSSYFSKVFSKYEGTSPAAWRKVRGGVKLHVLTANLYLRLFCRNVCRWSLRSSPSF